MVSEDNLSYMRGRNARYIVGTPKSKLHKVEKQLLETGDWTDVEPGVEVKLIDLDTGEGSER